MRLTWSVSCVRARVCQCESEISGWVYVCVRVCVVGGGDTGGVWVWL